MLYAPYLFAALIGLTILFIFRALWLFVPRRDPINERLTAYAKTEFSQMLDNEAASLRRRRMSPLQRIANGFGLGPWLARGLSQSDLPLTVAEFLLVMMVAGSIGFMLGVLRFNTLVGLAAGVVCACLPIVYLRIAQSRRQRAFTNQLPDVLTLLVGALRAGYGLTQAINVLTEKMPSPASVEFSRVMRAINLGIPVQQALLDMTERVGSDDLDLTVTAINVQYEVGGNLAHVMETISQTIRERLRILREVRVLTAQQRLTGYLLAAVPVFLALFISFANPNFFDPFFEAGPVRYLPYIGGGMVLIGFLIIRRVVDIKV